MIREELEKVLENHKLWLNNDCENMKSDSCYADLRYADLSHADLRYADLRYADLRYVDLSYANLHYTELSCANLISSNLYCADLYCANLLDTNFSFANLYCADLRGAENVPFIPYACPELGSFIGYKKAREYIIELEILADSNRLSATSRKCRCNKAKVLRILNFDRTVAEVTEVKSSYDSKFIYKVGDIVSVDNFDNDRWNECSTGIHFFINFKDAVDY